MLERVTPAEEVVVRGSAPLVLLGAVVLVATPAGAADCCCYRDLDTDAVYRNCGELFTALAFPQVVCTDPATGKAESHKFFGKWERLPESACDCGPPVPLPRRPRGKDDDAPAAGTPAPDDPSPGR